MNNIERRLVELEQKIAVSAIPSFETFSANWATMDALSKALFVEFAANSDDADGRAEQKLYRTISEYLCRMGVKNPDNAPSLREIATKLEKE